MIFPPPYVAVCTELSSELSSKKRIGLTEHVTEFEWLFTYNVVDVTSYRLQMHWTCVFPMAKRLPSAKESSWWSELLDLAIRMSKVNASAGLSGRDTMCFYAILQAFGIVELAAQDKSQHDMLIGSGVVDALEYGILHDFAYGAVAWSGMRPGVKMTSHS